MTYVLYLLGDGRLSLLVGYLVKYEFDLPDDGLGRFEVDGFLEAASDDGRHLLSELLLVLVVCRLPAS